MKDFYSQKFSTQFMATSNYKESPPTEPPTNWERVKYRLRERSLEIPLEGNPSGQWRNAQWGSADYLQFAIEDALIRMQLAGVPQEQLKNIGNASADQIKNYQQLAAQRIVLHLREIVPDKYLIERAVNETDASGDTNLRADVPFFLSSPDEFMYRASKKSHAVITLSGTPEEWLVTEICRNNFNDRMALRLSREDPEKVSFYQMGGLIVFANNFTHYSPKKGNGKAISDICETLAHYGVTPEKLAEISQKEVSEWPQRLKQQEKYEKSQRVAEEREHAYQQNLRDGRDATYLKMELRGSRLESTLQQGSYPPFEIALKVLQGNIDSLSEKETIFRDMRAQMYLAPVYKALLEMGAWSRDDTIFRKDS